MAGNYVGFRACFTDLAEVDDWSERLIELVESELGSRVHCVWKPWTQLMYSINDCPKGRRGVVERFKEGVDAPPYPYMVVVYARRLD